MKKILPALALVLSLGVSAGLSVPVSAHDELQDLIRRNCEKFLEEQRSLAEGGDSQAQFILGESYSGSYCTAKDLAAAFGWYRKAAEGGIAGAQFHLGLLYVEGSGVPQDYAAAADWLRKAAEGGDASAPIALGNMYESGTGVAEDGVQAHMWYSIAAAEGNDEARQRRDGLAEELEAEQIAQAQQLARDWWAQHR